MLEESMKLDENNGFYLKLGLKDKNI